jgi:hypothetical protein
MGLGRKAEAALSVEAVANRCERAGRWLGEGSERKWVGVAVALSRNPTEKVPVAEAGRMKAHWRVNARPEMPRSRGEQRPMDLMPWRQRYAAQFC